MAAYAIIDVDIHDIEAYMQFMAAIRPLLKDCGARYLARGGEFRVLEGDYQPRRLVLIEFPSMEVLEAFYDSDSYSCLRGSCQTCADSRLVALDGLSLKPLE